MVATAGLILGGVLATAALAASTNFAELATSPEAAGDAPHSVAAADLDGDSDQDLAFPNFGAGVVTVLRNNGAGNFTEFPASPEGVGNSPAAVAAADLDGDGDRDLAVANASDSDVAILRNNGAGNFTELGSSPETVGTSPFSIVAADLDGDGDRDLATANLESANLTVLRNNGAGNFTEPGSSPEPIGTDSFSVVAADLDGDGDQDLATASRFSSTVTVLRNNGGANFTEPGSSPEAVDALPRALVAADLDGDGDSDLAVATEQLDEITTLRNNGAANFTEFGSSPEIAGDRPFGITAADFDADTDQDLAVVNTEESTATILRNNGSANFAEPGSSPEPTGVGPFAIAAADLDGDSDPDLAAANFGGDSTTILRNR